MTKILDFIKQEKLNAKFFTLIQYNFHAAIYRVMSITMIAISGEDS